MAAGPDSWEAAGRRIYGCPACALRWADPSDWPDREREFDHYRRHENHVSDGRYERFLGRVVPVLRRWVPPGSAGIDIGCGP
ncbi:MAG: hypothetical protein R3336_02915, partial [Phycisphaeraceae bacterium]|nr:hypothetical protein [Phycisphaeraceae bacterium]